MMDLEYLVVENGFFVPKGIVSDFDLIYDEDRRIVHESLLVRGENKEDIVSIAPEVLPSSYRATQPGRLQKALFLGWYDAMHYGHWLTEGLARFWYLALHDKADLKILAAGNMYAVSRRIRDRILYSKTTHWKAGLSSFGISRADFLFASKITRIPKIIVPQCSMHNRREIHDLHISVTRNIAQSLAEISAIAEDARPVYLSRTKASSAKRTHIGERPVEDYCRKIGMRIVFPETMSLRDQVVLFNAHNTFIGFIGSAFHSLMFRSPDRPATCIYLSDGKRNHNCDTLDALMGNQSFYLPCAEHREGGGLLVNANCAIDGLDNLRQLKQI